MSHPFKNRLRRTMMFLNAQRPALLKDAYIYRPDSVMFDLEDAVAENQKDAARFSLYHTLTTVDYQGVERIVRINGLDTPHWREDIRVCVAGGADGNPHRQMRERQRRSRCRGVCASSRAGIWP
jgi:citrate lyase subunit beta/citryl-CoA lyase